MVGIRDVDHQDGVASGCGSHQVQAGIGHKGVQVSHAGQAGAVPGGNVGDYLRYQLMPRMGCRSGRASLGIDRPVQAGSSHGQCCHGQQYKDEASVGHHASPIIRRNSSQRNHQCQVHVPTAASCATVPSRIRAAAVESRTSSDLIGDVNNIPIFIINPESGKACFGAGFS